MKWMDTIEQTLNIKVSFPDEVTMDDYDIEEYGTGPVIDTSTSIINKQRQTITALKEITDA